MVNTAKLVEVFQIGSEKGGVLDLPERFWPEPGQYLPCQWVGDDLAPLVTHLFRVIGENESLSISPVTERWQPGDQLIFDSPQGHGFRLPPEARRIALLPYRVSPIRVLSLVKKALASGASISLFCESIPHAEIMSRLPSIVEVNPLSVLLDDMDWPDFLAADLERDDLTDFSTLFEQVDLKFEGQVLVRTPMPCRGLAECGVCSVKTKKGWKYACIDGPVFPLMEIIHVAQ